MGHKIPNSNEAPGYKSKKDLAMKLAGDWDYTTKQILKVLNCNTFRDLPNYSDRVERVRHIESILEIATNEAQELGGCCQAYSDWIHLRDSIQSHPNELLTMANSLAKTSTLPASEILEVLTSDSFKRLPGTDTPTGQAGILQTIIRRANYNNIGLQVACDQALEEGEGPKGVRVGPWVEVDELPKGWGRLRDFSKEALKEWEEPQIAALFIGDIVHQAPHDCAKIVRAGDGFNIYDTPSHVKFHVGVGSQCYTLTYADQVDKTEN